MPLGPGSTRWLSFPFSLSIPMPAFPGVTSQTKGTHVINKGHGAPRCDGGRDASSGMLRLPGDSEPPFAREEIWDRHRKRHVLLKSKCYIHPRFRRQKFHRRLWKQSRLWEAKEIGCINAFSSQRWGRKSVKDVIRSTDKIGTDSRLD